MTASPSSSFERHVVVPTEAGRRGALLVHVLAQLPDSVTASLSGDGTERKELELLLRAYGLEDRLVPAAPSASSPTPKGCTLAELVESLAPEGGRAASVRGDDSLFAGERVAILTNLPVHYRLPLFAGIGRRLAGAGAALHVAFAAERDVTRDWLVPSAALDFDHTFLRGLAGLERLLERLRPTVVLVAGFSLRSARAAAWARLRRVAYGVWTGDIAATAARYGRIRVGSRRAILSGATFAVAYGSLAAEYVAALDPNVPVVLGRNASPVPVPGRRGGREGTEILTVARAVPGKGLDMLLDAFGRLEDSDCRLTVAGGGTELRALAERAARLPQVRFTGELAPDTVRELVAEADIFAFPSQIDVFGLSLLEAMGGGAAVATGPKPGVAADLVVDGVNGIVVARDDVDAWADALRVLVADRGLREALGAKATRTVTERWTLDHAVDAMVAGLRLGVLRRRP